MDAHQVKELKEIYRCIRCKKLIEKDKMFKIRKNSLFNFSGKEEYDLICGECKDGR